MKLLTLGISHVSRKLWLNIFIFVQVAVIIVSANIMVANMNSRKLLYSPLSYVMEKDGYLFSSSYDDDDDRVRYEKLKKAEGKLKGNVSL